MNYCNDLAFRSCRYFVGNTTENFLHSNIGVMIKKSVAYCNSEFQTWRLAPTNIAFMVIGTLR
jgi:hypothetical protein